MTQFVKDQFAYHGGYLVYNLDAGFCAWDRRKFIARFKYSAGEQGRWMTFLIKNFTVEEYLGRIEAGESPLTILESKGYVCSNVRKILKRNGYPLTQAGQKAYLDDQAARREFQVVTIIPAR